MSEENWSPKDGSEGANEIEHDAEEVLNEVGSSQAPHVETVECDPTYYYTDPEDAWKPQQTVYEKGCLGAAWQDITNSKGWFGKLALMALIEFVPILNWVVDGFALRWGRELIFGKIQDMPKKIFGNRCFVTGAMNFLVVLVLILATTLITSLLGLFPVVGAIIGVMISVFATMIINICRMRMAIFDELSEGFAVGKGYEAGKGNWGKVFCVGIVPDLLCSLIADAIIIVLLLIFAAVFGAVYLVNFSDLVMQYGGLDNFGYAVEADSTLQLAIATMVLNGVLAGLPFLILGWYIWNLFKVTAIVWGARATGHYAARYCKNWKTEPSFSMVAQRE